MISLKYRSDIDGLRAIAVLGVVIFHAFPQNLPGGFSGVDIFFVISGYLISGILYKGHREGGFSFKEFYARRIRRLFPALITMLALSLAYGWVILLPDEFEQMGKHIAAGTLFIQNFVFWGESGYFDTAANLKPMLHLWSLAVEEQFYIIFPLVLIVLWKRPRILVPAMVILLVGSFVLNVVMSYQAAMTDFFLTPYRAWEFLAGSLLAWWHYDKEHEEEVPKWREAMSWGGALLLAAGMVLLSKQQGAYPGWRALLPVCGTCLLIEGGRGAWVNRRILSNPALVWIGLISYPLYLFHWPILSFLHIVKGESPGDGYLAGAIGLSFLLATLTYYLIEKRIRHNASRRTLPILIALFAIMGVVGYLGESGIIKTHACRFGLDENVQASRENNYFDDFKREKLGFNYSRYTYGGGAKKTLYVGDSHMEQYAPRIRVLIDQGKAADRGAVFLTRGGFLPIYDIVTTDKPGDIGFPKTLFESVLDPSVDRVVVCANWCYYFNIGGPMHLAHNHPMDKPEGMDAALGDLESFLQSLQSRGIHPYLVLNMPGSMGYDPKLMIQRGLLGGFSISESRLTAKEFLEAKGRMTCTQGDLMDRMRAIAARTGTTIIDPMPVMAPDGVCVRFEGRKPIYHDLAHLTSSYVRKHASFMDPTISKEP
jgi:peptidoglycan/LPS O-acetylase OafA/YrhL